MDQSVFEIDKDLVSRKNQDGTVVLMRIDESDNFYKIDGVAIEVWELLSNGASLKSIYKALSEKYSVEEKVIIQDTENFISDLLRLGLIKQNS